MSGGAAAVEQSVASLLAEGFCGKASPFADRYERRRARRPTSLVSPWCHRARGGAIDGTAIPPEPAFSLHAAEDLEPLTFGFVVTCTESSPVPAGPHAGRSCASVHTRSKQSLAPAPPVRARCLTRASRAPGAPAGAAPRSGQQKRLRELERLIRRAGLRVEHHGRHAAIVDVRTGRWIAPAQVSPSAANWMKSEFPQLRRKEYDVGDAHRGPPGFARQPASRGFPPRRVRVGPGAAGAPPHARYGTPGAVPRARRPMR